MPRDLVPHLGIHMGSLTIGDGVVSALLHAFGTISHNWVASLALLKEDAPNSAET